MHSSRNTIREVFQRAKLAGIQWPLDDAVTNEELTSLLYPERVKTTSQRKEPDYSYIYKELAKPGVNFNIALERILQHLPC